MSLTSVIRKVYIEELIKSTDCKREGVMSVERKISTIGVFQATILAAQPVNQKTANNTIKLVARFTKNVLA